MNKAIFLDRDGTLNRDDGYVHEVEDFKLLPNVIKGLKLLKDNFKLFIITNQSGIGRGYYTEENFLEFNNHLVDALKQDNIRIEKTFVCPHHPDEKCDCRKPTTKHIKEAEKEFNLNLKNSYVIGDHGFDIEMGKKTGCKKIFVLTGHGKKHLNELKTKPDFIAKDLLEAAKWILNDQ